jgi:hypothetical protein
MGTVHAVSPGTRGNRGTVPVFAGRRNWGWTRNCRGEPVCSPASWQFVYRRDKVPRRVDTESKWGRFLTCARNVECQVARGL